MLAAKGAKMGSQESEPNENTRRHTGEKVPYTGDYKTACCGAVSKFSKDKHFFPCQAHGETDWSWIPPVDALPNVEAPPSFLQR